MRIKALIQALTGTSHIVCESIETDASTGAINIIAHPDRKSQYRCGICGKTRLHGSAQGGTERDRERGGMLCGLPRHKRHGDRRQRRCAQRCFGGTVRLFARLPENGGARRLSLRCGRRACGTKADGICHAFLRYGGNAAGSVFTAFAGRREKECERMNNGGECRRMRRFLQLHDARGRGEKETGAF